jgi:hypothetical protein
MWVSTFNVSAHNELAQLVLSVAQGTAKRFRYLVVVKAAYQQVHFFTQRRNGIYFSGYFRHQRYPHPARQKASCRDTGSKKRPVHTLPYPQCEKQSVSGHEASPQN